MYIALQNCAWQHHNIDKLRVSLPRAQRSHSSIIFLAQISQSVMSGGAHMRQWGSQSVYHWFSYMTCCLFKWTPLKIIQWFFKNQNQIFSCRKLQQSFLFNALRTVSSLYALACGLSGAKSLSKLDMATQNDIRLEFCQTLVCFHSRIPQNHSHKSHQIPKFKCSSPGLSVVCSQSIEDRF